MNTKSKNTEKNFYQTWVDSQKQMIDTMTEATHKFTTNETVNETIDKGSDILKNWLDTQVNLVNKSTEMVDGTNLTAENMNETAKNWMETQMNLTRDFMNFSLNTMKSYMESLNKAVPTVNGNKELINNMFESNMNLYKQWNDSFQSQYDNMMKSFSNTDLQNTWKGFLNQTAMLNQFAEMWAPVVKAMQENKFSPEQMTNMFSNASYTEFINKMFGFGGEAWTNFANMMNPSTAGVNDVWSNMSKMFAPSHNPFAAQMNNWINNLNNQPANGMFNNYMKTWMSQYNNSPMASYFNNMNSNFNNQFAGFMNMNQGQEMFNYWNNLYNSMYTNLQNAYAPMAKLMTPNETKTNLDNLNALAHKMNQFMLKQGEMQYATYTTGMKAMAEIANRLKEKFANGEEFKGMNNLYNEWLTVSDKVFVELFESDAYAKLQAEYASLAHSLKKDSELMMEKMMAHIPVITRTEMDDTYKTMYELKKRITELEKQVENAANNSTSVSTENTAKVAPKKK